MKWHFSSESGGVLTSSHNTASEEAAGYQQGKAFEADRKDSIFAILAFVLGFFFIRWVLLSWMGWGVTAFTAGYCSAVTVYLLKKGIRIPRSGFFWLAAVALTGASYSLYTNNGLEPWRSLFLFCSAIYFVISASGRLVLGATGNWLLLDGINGTFVIPFKNFGCQYKSLSSPQYIKRGLGGRFLSIVLGLLLALLVAGMVLPLLMRADSGGFIKIADGLYKYYLWFQDQFMDIIINCILAIPVAAYLFGLVAGSAHNRGCDTFRSEDVRHMLSSVRVLAAATVYTVLGLTCCLYLVFIGSQLPYFFSAFFGQRPDGWQVYSEYARSGFFELCQIAAINLTLLVLANIFSRKPRAEDPVLKLLNCLLAMLTLLLIATAFSKMALYIGAYGLSMRRLLPCLFMVFLFVVCCGVIAMQKWQFSIVRLSAIAGTMMLCTLCILNPDGLVANYNADRYLSGTLEGFDVEILYRSGPAGVEPALRVYGQTGDAALKERLLTYIYDQQQDCISALGKTQDSLQNAIARQKLSEFRAR